MVLKKIKHFFSSVIRRVVSIFSTAFFAIGNAFGGIEKTKFSPIGAIMAAFVFVGLNIYFRLFLFLSYGSEELTAGYDGLYLSVGILFVVGSVLLALFITLAYMQKIKSAWLILPSAIVASAFVVNIVYALCKSQSYYMSIEILFAIMFIISAAIFFAALANKLNVKKTAIFLFAFTGIALFSAFVPVIVGRTTLMLSITNNIPYALIFAAYALLTLGIKEEEKDA